MLTCLTVISVSFLGGLRVTSCPSLNGIRLLCFQIEIDEDDVDDRFRSLFGQLAGNVSSRHDTLSMLTIG